MALYGVERIDDSVRRGLGWLVAARLLLAGLSLGLAFTVDRLEDGQGGPAIWGVYWTVAAAFTATVLSALMVGRTRRPERFATVQVAIDVGIVTALVYFSGGGESVFTFLYALVVLYGALVVDRTGVGLAAGLAAAGYGFVLFGGELGLLPMLVPDSRSEPLLVLAAYWAFYAAALLVLGMLANTLSAELRRTGAALDARTQDLEQLQDLHRRTVESIGSGLLTTDSSGKITSFNPEAERITGLAASAARGQALDEVIPGAREIVHEDLGTSDPAVSTGRARIPFRNLRGDDLFLGIGASRLRDAEGYERGEVVIFQDVSAVVSMEHELRQSERLAAVGEMAARIAHEIRNPLASISGSVQILQSEGFWDAEGADAKESEPQRLMGIVVREVDRLNGLIQDFLQYTRPAPVRRETVNPARLVEDVIQMSQGHRPPGIEVTLELDPSVRLVADPTQLEAVVWNLWNNALHALGDSGRIGVRIEQRPGDPSQALPGIRRNADEGSATPAGVAGGTVLLTFEDSGSGIAPESLERIFEPFFTTKPEGTGLGLATVQRIIEQHGGAIQVESEEGGGTCFRIGLPARPEDAS